MVYILFIDNNFIILLPGRLVMSDYGREIKKFCFRINDMGKSLEDPCPEGKSEQKKICVQGRFS